MEQSTTPARKTPVQLHHDAGDVLVTTRDNDKFFISAAKAAEACLHATRLSEQIEFFRTELEQPLREWCAARADRVRACYMPLPMGDVKVFIVTKSRRFDFDLANEVADLEVQLSDHWRIGVRQLPDADAASLAAFYNADEALRIYADGGPTPG